MNEAVTRLNVVSGKTESSVENTLYAQWDKEITLHACGGAFSDGSESKKVYFAEKTYPIPALNSQYDLTKTPSDYAKNWKYTYFTDKSSGGDTWYDTVNGWRPGFGAGDIPSDLYAKWYYDVTVKYHNGTSSDSTLQIRLDGAVNKPSKRSYPGYTLRGTLPAKLEEARSSMRTETSLRAIQMPMFPIRFTLSGKLIQSITSITRWAVFRSTSIAIRGEKK